MNFIQKKPNQIICGDIIYPMISIESASEPDSKWNDRLINSEMGTVYQTKEYATSFELSTKSKPKFLKFFSDSGELVGQLLLFQYFKGQKRLGRIIGRGRLFSNATKLLKLLPKSYHWVYGPVIFNFQYQDEIFESLGDYIVKENSNFYGISHPLNSNFSFSKKFNFKTNDNGTFIINLNDGIEQIFKNTDKRSVQKNIKRSKERNVKITQINSHDDILVYYEILKKFREDNNLLPYSYKDIVEGFEIVKNVCQKGFLAWHEDVPIGGILFSTFNGYINELGIARTQKDYNEKLYALEYLRWKIIEWGIESKCKYYDLSGVELNKKNSKADRIYRNKQRWGGNLTIYPSWFN